MAAVASWTPFDLGQAGPSIRLKERLLRSIHVSKGGSIGTARSSILVSGVLARSPPNRRVVNSVVKMELVGNPTRSLFGLVHVPKVRIRDRTRRFERENFGRIPYGLRDSPEGRSNQLGSIREGRRTWWPKTRPQRGEPARPRRTEAHLRSRGRSKGIWLRYRREEHRSNDPRCRNCGSGPPIGHVRASVGRAAFDGCTTFASIRRTEAKPPLSL